MTSIETGALPTELLTASRAQTGFGPVTSGLAGNRQSPALRY